MQNFELTYARMLKKLRAMTEGGAKAHPRPGPMPEGRFLLGGEEITQKAAKEFLGDLLDKAEINKPLTAKQDVDFVRQLHARHERARAVPLDAVEDYLVVQSRRPEKRLSLIMAMCFDDTVVTFSPYSVFASKSPNARLKALCRDWVSFDIYEFRREFFDGKGTIECPVTSLQIPFANCHVDHVYPNTFLNIYSAFIDEFNIQVEALDFNSIKSIEDSGIKDDFVAFHREFGVFSVVSPVANMALIPAYIHQTGEGKLTDPEEIDPEEFYAKVRTFHTGVKRRRK